MQLDRTRWYALVMSIGCLAPAGAEEAELATDRPDFTETAVVVPRGRFQLEMGFTFAEGKDGLNVLSGPETLLRYGIGPRTELRFVAPDYLRVRGAGRASGFGDLAVGLKQQLGPLPGGFDLALIAHATLPTGASAFTSHRVDPDASLAWSRDLNDRTAVGGLLGLAWPTEGGRRNVTGVSTVALGHSLGGRWGVFLEWAAEFPERGGNTHLAHHGYTYALSPDSQLDLHFGFGLTPAAPEFFVGAGYSRKFR